MQPRMDSESVTLRESYACFPIGVENRGGLNGSMQHYLEVCLQWSLKLESFASVDSNGKTTLVRF